MKHQLPCGCSYDDRTMKWCGLCQAHGDYRDRVAVPCAVQTPAAPAPEPLQGPPAADEDTSWMEG